MALLLVAVVGLFFSSDRFVLGAAAVARQLGVSPLVIGLTLVSIGTSAPEILVSISAAMKGTIALAVGNALGSNLANTGLVLGLTALLCAIPISRAILKRELVVMLAVTLIVGLVLIDGHLGRIESIALILGMFGFLWLILRAGLPPEAQEVLADIEEHPVSSKTNWLWVIAGLAGMLVSAELLVNSAVVIASRIGVSELVIGVSVVAVGTSLPELSASVASALRGKTDIALGNVLGSNIFNLLIVLPVAGLIHPGDVPPEAFTRDFVALLLISALLAFFCFVGGRRGAIIGRLTGASLLIMYLVYCFLLFAQ